VSKETVCETAFSDIRSFELHEFAIIKLRGVTTKLKYKVALILAFERKRLKFVNTVLLKMASATQKRHLRIKDLKGF
jgi:hypothetical protein